jgi:cyclic-di-AMP phosphodiesterase PgpH
LASSMGSPAGSAPLPETGDGAVTHAANDASGAGGSGDPGVSSGQDGGCPPLGNLTDELPAAGPAGLDGDAGRGQASLVSSVSTPGAAVTSSRSGNGDSPGIAAVPARLASRASPGPDVPVSPVAARNGGRGRPGRRLPYPPTWLSPALFVIGLTAALTFVLAFQFIPGQVQISEGEVAKQNIRAPQKISYVSQIKTKEAKDKAVLAVADVYDYDPSLAQQQKTLAAAACQAITVIRFDFQSTVDQKRERLEKLADLRLSDKAISETLASTDPVLQTVCSESVRVVEEVMRERLRPAGIAAVTGSLAGRFNPSSPASPLSLTTELATAFIKPNETLNAETTAARKREAQALVDPVRVTVEKSEIVVREGNVVTALDLERLEALGLRNASIAWTEILGRGLLALALVVILALYLWQFHPKLWLGERRTVLLFLLIIITVAIAKSTLPGRVGLLYLFPFAAVPMIAALLLDQQLALLLTVVLSLLMGPIAENSLEITTLSLIGGAVGVLSLRRVERISAFLWAGIYVALANYAIILAFHLPTGDYDGGMWATLAGTSLANGVISAAIVATAALPLGYFFGITTLIQLLELAHPSQPLFRRLLLEAPGTYHHSVIVASLAERAASAIGADTLLARVAAYYHDVGKIARPYFFIENQAEGANIHDDMDPSSSARAILSHVTEGVTLARRYRLPAEVRDVIQQHHGSRLASFFYGKAATAASARGQDLSEEDFRYPGPKPQTKVAALVMLADAVEATVRSNPRHASEELERTVREIVLEQMLDQLDESGLTLTELEAIRKAFVSVLQGVYHPRLQYPVLAAPQAPFIERRRSTRNGGPAEPGEAAS